MLPFWMTNMGVSCAAVALLVSQPVLGASQDGGPGRLAPTLPGPLGYVSDYADVLDDDWKARIRSVCQDLERKTGVEMVVVTVNSRAPYVSANDYADALYRRWGIGTAQRDYGVLVLTIVEEQQAAVTLGRSMVSVVSAQLLGKIKGEYLSPSFNDARFGEGLYRSVVTIASAAQEIRVGVQSRSRVKGLAIFLTVLTVAGALIVLWWISRPALRHPYGRLRRGEFWGSGQGGFGGNFGGFGGGTGREGLR